MRPSGAHKWSPSEDRTPGGAKAIGHPLLLLSPNRGRYTRQDEALEVQNSEQMHPKQPDADATGFRTQRRPGRPQ